VDERADALFDAFVRARLAELLRFGHVLSGNPHTAADLVQDALERTLLAWPRIQKRDDPEGYVRRTMINGYISIWRRRSRERLVAQVPDIVLGSEPPGDADLMHALAQLPPRARAVVVLRFYQDLSEREAAAVLGCSVGTVKSQTARALARLRTQMGAAAGRGSPWTA
jgi:RNA polymerase sigma-70 factor (sigma-E family)